jgi:energy-coupling factor transport system permease protein
MAFALLVLAIRRGSKLATAMEARGFGAPTPRTWARPSSVGRADTVVVVVSALMSLTAIGASVAAGTFNLVGA